MDRAAAYARPMRGSLALVAAVVSGTVGLTGTGIAAAASWRPLPVPLPAGASSATLNAVACARGSLCWAVGTARIRHHGDRAIAERYNGRRWQLRTVPSPAARGGSALSGTGPYYTLDMDASARQLSARYAAKIAWRWSG